MIATTLNSLASFLVTEEPDWNTPIKGTFSLLTSQNESSTRRQERIAYSNTIRTALTWTSYQDYTTANATLSSLHSLGMSAPETGSFVPLQPILCPFWPGMYYYQEGTPTPYSSYWSVIWEPGFTSWAIFVSTAGIGGYTATPQSMVAPLLVGIFDKLPKVTAQTDEDIIVEFQFTENGPAAQSLSVSGSVQTGPAWQGASSWPIFIEVPQNSSVQAGQVDIVIARKQIGYTRDMAQTVYPQTPNRTIKSDFVLSDGGESLLAMWLQCCGDVYPFWMPAAFSPCKLTADVTTGNSVTVDNVAALDSQEHIFLASGSSWAAEQITGESGNTLTLASAPGSFDHLFTYVQPLLFGHFVGPTIEIQWTDPNLATATLNFEELPPEYGSPSGETFATTIGPIGTRAFLYQVTDGTNHWYWTSYEQAITHNGITYTPQHISHGTISEKINLEDSSTDLTMRYFTPNPFTKFRTPRLQLALTITIIEVTTALGAIGLNDGYTNSTVTLFVGTVKTIKFNDSQIVVTLGGPTSIFDRMIPRPLVQLQCNATLFDSKCGLSRSQWTFAATMPSPPAPGAPFQYTVDALSWPQGALPTLGAHYFAFGYIVRTLSDGTQQANLIMDSGVITGGQIVLTMNGDLSPFPTGSESWSIVPNCAGRYNEDCGSTFNNKANFRGFPFMPLTDPSVLASTLVVPSSSKK